MTDAGWQVSWRGRLKYADALAEQTARRELVIRGEAPNTVWMLEHEPVVTLGRRGGEIDRALLAARGTDVVETRRGGLATWHGPGQLVAYFMVDLPKMGWSVRQFVHGMESGMIRLLSTLGVEASRREGTPGVFVQDGKIGSVGLHVKRGVTMHGLSLNLCLGEGAFEGMVPCGLVGVTPVDVRRCGGLVKQPEDLAFPLSEHLLDAIREAHA